MAGRRKSIVDSDESEDV